MQEFVGLNLDDWWDIHCFGELENETLTSVPKTELKGNTAYS